MKVKISVIVPMYNVENYIENCVASLLCQTYDNIEIILVDNGSTDNTYHIAQRLQKKDSRIKLYVCTKKGPSATRNVGIEKCTGQYITFVDADDWIEPETYAVIVDEINQKGSDIILYGYDVVDQVGNKIKKNSSEYFKDGYYENENYRKFLMHMAFTAKGRNIPSYVYLRVIKREIIEKNKIKFDEKVYRSEDFQFLIKVHENSTDMSNIYSKKMYRYRQNASSITHKYTENYWEMVERIFSDLIQFAKAKEDFELVRQLNMRYLIYIVNAVENEMNNRKYSAIRSRIREILRNDKIKNIKSKVTLLKGIREIGLSYIYVKYPLLILVNIIEMIKRCKHG